MALKNYTILIFSWKAAIKAILYPELTIYKKKSRGYKNCVCVNISISNYMSRDIFMLHSHGYLYLVKILLRKPGPLSGACVEASR